MRVLVAMTEKTRAGFHDEINEKRKAVTMALEGNKMCGIVGGANSNCAGRFPQARRWRDANVLQVLSSGIRIEAYYINQATLRVHQQPRAASMAWPHQPHSRGGRAPTGRPVTAPRPRAPGASAPRSSPAGSIWNPGRTAADHGCLPLHFHQEPPPDTWCPSPPTVSNAPNLNLPSTDYAAEASP